MFHSSNASTLDVKALSYTPYPFISVDNDAELADVASAGIGTELDPYIIEGYNITPSSSNHAIHD